MQFLFLMLSAQRKITAEHLADFPSGISSSYFLGLLPLHRRIHGLKKRAIASMEERRIETRQDFQQSPTNNGMILGEIPFRATVYFTRQSRNADAGNYLPKFIPRFLFLNHVGAGEPLLAELLDLITGYFLLKRLLDDPKNLGAFLLPVPVKNLHYVLG